MKNKKKFVFGIALVLLVLVAGIAFAAKGEKDGVYWIVIEGSSARIGKTNTGYYMEVYNSNDYTVEVYILGTAPNTFRVRAGETVHKEARRDAEFRTVSRVR